MYTQKSPIYPQKPYMAATKGNVQMEDLLLGISAKEPNINTKDPYTSAKEPCTAAKEPHLSAEEPCMATITNNVQMMDLLLGISAKEPCISTKEPHLSAEEPYIFAKVP